MLRLPHLLTSIHRGGYVNSFGPTNRALAVLDANGQEQLWSDHNTATDGSTAVDAEYLEVIATRRQHGHRT